VANTGEYIEHSDIERIFDRFYRTDKSRNSSTGGHGIGLSIAKTIVDRLDGTLRAESVHMAPGADGTGVGGTGGTGASIVGGKGVGGVGAVNTFTIALPGAQ
jgi:signal transduction histidine kinase